MDREEELQRILDNMPTVESKEALDVAISFGQYDGDHHKAWVIDEMVRALLGSKSDYEWFVDVYQMGEDGPHTHDWKHGIAP
jgi:hypothetical protein